MTFKGQKLKLLRGKRFEQKPKRVVKSPQFRDYCGVESDVRLLLDFNEVLDCLHNGEEIPDRFYKLNVDRHGDRLLNEIGVKHLHLGGQGSDVIVYFAEFDRAVELIEINGHIHLESEPRGAALRGYFRHHARASTKRN